ncbi:MAG: ABC transporter permease [Candidatus Viridilinea halotolerans]|uniref:ABC transporter permease n=1 Tax=Candidatus Viridilinea halotolerans TaxID=2491704 RepID=A0A426TQE9_9CHLR|nr:MAG: ABC transporter permease [Candidatus Viridilinea halotolerans]
MQRTLLVARHDFLRHLRRPSFLIATAALPLLLALMFWFIGVGITEADDAPTEGARQSIGYVDHSGLLASPDPDLAAYLRHFPDRASAEAALGAGELAGFYEFPADYLTGGTVVWVGSATLGAQGQTAVANLVRAGLLAEEPELAAQLMRPTSFEHSTPAASEALAEQPLAEDMLPLMLPYVFAMILYATILSSASFLLQSVTEEKENRTIEIILTSLRPLELLTGKVLGLGLLGLVQVGFWLGSGLLLLQLSGMTPPTEGSTLAWGTIALMFCYYLLGYLVYGSLLAAVGAVVGNVREGSQFVTLLVIPSVIPLWFLGVLISQPDGLLARSLSLFPLTAPVTMMIRAPLTNLAAWEVGLSLLLLAATAAGTIWIASRLFRAASLLSGQRISVGVIMRALRA